MYRNVKELDKFQRSIVKFREVDENKEIIEVWEY